ncbi:hypothetical protein D9619_002381 [Psilocybe cf. subviscida]|uniref:Uncharacterized protein n=1 Tax=Psilocybe cf. subviscida TaxID=2480587 RepID=A0A8H5AY73_9AGAR|nr:hypothetical protein D9619_002381 [Psilocybe cf. subviscida]
MRLRLDASTQPDRRRDALVQHAYAQHLHAAFPLVSGRTALPSEVDGEDGCKAPKQDAIRRIETQGEAATTPCLKMPSLPTTATPTFYNSMVKTAMKPRSKMPSARTRFRAKTATVLTSRCPPRMDNSQN